MGYYRGMTNATMTAREQAHAARNVLLATAEFVRVRQIGPDVFAVSITAAGRIGRLTFEGGRRPAYDCMCSSAVAGSIWETWPAAAK